MEFFKATLFIGNNFFFNGPIMEEMLYKYLFKTGMAVVNNNTCISCKSIGVVMHFSKILHGKRGVTDTTAWSVIQDGG